MKTYFDFCKDYYYLAEYLDEHDDLIDYIYVYLLR